MKTSNLIKYSVLLSLAALIIYSNAMAAAANFQFIQHSSLIGHNAGVDGYWGTADDDNGAIANTATGSASYAYGTGVFIDYYSGSFSVVGPIRSPGLTEFASMSTSAESGRIGSLKTTVSNPVTHTGVQRFVTTATTTSGTGDFTGTGVSGFIIINRPGQDDPSIFGVPNMTAHFNLMKTLVPANWTVILLEFQSIDGSYPTNGLIASSYSTDIIAIANYSAARFADANGDGNSDVFWRNDVTNANKLYLMNGNLVGTDADISIPSVNDPAWEVVGNADFDKDGQGDILWRNSSTGLNHISVMNGTATPAGVDLSIPALIDSQWKVGGIGDFDGDGNQDIFWHHDGGENRITFMNGTTQGVTSNVNTISDTNWKVSGIADFDLDGKDDVLWRHDVNRRVWLYLMNGAVISNVGGAGEHVAFTSENWDIEGVGDFNADGKGDLLWRHNTNGRVWMYLMNGAAISNSTSGAPGEHVAFTALDWNVKAIGDYNGDGKQDIFWRNDADGRNHMYLMDGVTVTPTAGGIEVAPLADLNWKVLGR